MMTRPRSSNDRFFFQPYVCVDGSSDRRFKLTVPGSGWDPTAYGHLANLHVGVVYGILFLGVSAFADWVEAYVQSYQARRSFSLSFLKDPSDGFGPLAW